MRWPAGEARLSRQRGGKSGVWLGLRMLRPAGGGGGCWKSGEGIAGAWSASLGEAPRDWGQLTVQRDQS